MRTSRFTIASLACVGAVGFAAVVYAQTGYKSDNTVSPSTSAAQTTQTQSVGAIGNQPKDGVLPSDNAKPENGMNTTSPNNGMSTDNSLNSNSNSNTTNNSNMSTNSTGTSPAAEPLNERPARADRN